MGIKSAWRRVFGADAETRDTFNNPQFLSTAWGGAKTSSGETVTASSAMGWSAYFACIRNISEDVGKLPRGVFEASADGGRVERRDHPLWRVLHVAPNPEMSAMTFFETLTAHALGMKGGFAEIVRDARGIVRELWPLDPNTVTVETDSAGVVVYRICGEFTPSENILHMHGLGYEGVTGYALHALAKESLGRSLAAQSHNGAMLGNGAMVSGVIEVPKMMSDDAFARLRSTWQARHGGASNSGKPVILEQDAKYKPIGLDAEKSQLMESINTGVVDTARWFRMPPHKIQHLDNATFSNIEQQNIQYVVDCLTSWLTRWEQELARKVFTGQAAGLFLKFNVNGLLRGDMAGRATFYREMFSMGAMNTNDIRASEDMPPIGDDGDARYVPSNLMLLGSQGPTVQDDAQAVRKIADAFVPVAARAFADLSRVARDKAGRAAKRDNLAAWAAEYFADTDHTRGVMGMVAEAFADTVSASRGDAPDSNRAEAAAFVMRDAARYSQGKLETVETRAMWCSEADAVHFLDRLCVLLTEGKT